jgi:hypothetical protein
MAINSTSGGSTIESRHRDPKFVGFTRKHWKRVFISAGVVSIAWYVRLISYSVSHPPWQMQAMVAALFVAIVAVMYLIIAVFRFMDWTQERPSDVMQTRFSTVDYDGVLPNWIVGLVAAFLVILIFSEGDDNQLGFSETRWNVIISPSTRVSLIDDGLVSRYQSVCEFLLGGCGGTIDGHSRTDAYHATKLALQDRYPLDSKTGARLTENSCWDLTERFHGFGQDKEGRRRFRVVSDEALGGFLVTFELPYWLSRDTPFILDGDATWIVSPSGERWEVSVSETRLVGAGFELGKDRFRKYGNDWAIFDDVC